jgi:transcription elongation factor GreA
MTLMTKKGLVRLRDTIAKLRIEEKEAIEAIQVARGFGDFSENAELDSAKDWLRRTLDRIGEYEKLESEVEVLNLEGRTPAQIAFGCKVTLLDTDTEKKMEYKIVSEFEADLAQNKISINSPIAKALIGKKIEDEVSVKVPSGEKNLKVLNTNYDWLND